MLWIDDILKNSWLLKDNCFVCDTAYLIADDSGVTTATSLRLQYLLTLSTGDLGKVEITKEDLINIQLIHDQLEIYFSKNESSSQNFMLEKSFSRLGRGLLFIKQAREARNLAYKISNYCAAFETLITTENMEISHKLSERVAFFVKDSFNKLQTYKLVKKAYSIRSKLTHGSSIDKKDIEIMSELSSEIDKILRSIFTKIINDKELFEIFDSSHDRIDKYFEELIFA